MKNEQSIIANETTSQFNLYAERLAEIGFDPIPIPFNKKYPIDKGWPKKIYKPGQQWNLHGVGHRCPTIGVIDADITDIDLAFEFLSGAGMSWAYAGFASASRPSGPHL